MRIPKTDSIQELARFWDTHDLTDFQDQLEEVNEPLFDLEPVVRVRLEPDEIRAVREKAKSKGVGFEELIREWIRERI